MQPDFDSGKGYYWMKQTHAAIQAGTRDKLPHRPALNRIDHFTPAARQQLARHSFNDAVERRLTRKSFSFSGVSFDKEGKIIR